MKEKYIAKLIVDLIESLQAKVQLRDLRIARLELENEELKKSNRELLNRYPSRDRWVDAGE